MATNFNSSESSYVANRLSQDGERSSFLSQEGGLGTLLGGERGSVNRRSRASVERSSLHKVMEDGEEGEEDVEKEYSPEEAAIWLTPTSPQNRGIFASYFSVGFGLYFILTPITFYMVDDLNATPTQQAVVLGLQSLPWALKIFCGFLTDSTPIMGYRRKPYFALGWTMYIVCNIVLAIIAKPTIAILALFVFAMTLAFVQADVCTDAMIVERSKLFELSENRGHLQAAGYITRFFGSIIGALLGAILYNQSAWGWGVPIWGIFIINACVPLFIITPFFYSLVEMKSEKPPSIREQVQSIWTLVQRRAVWQPCSFIYIYNVFFLTNPAWNSFLVDGLGFSNFEIGMLTLVAAILSYVALIIYRRYLFNTSWRWVYVGATLVAFIFTSIQLFLVLGWNNVLGMKGKGWELFWAMGSYGVVQFVGAIQFLPACRMFLGMCPEGAEGASYAMLTTLSNLAGTVAYSVAGAFATVFNVTNDNLSDHNYSGMWKLTLLCGCIQLVGLLFIGLLPSGVEEQIKLQQNDYSSKFAGSVFIGIVGISLLFVISFTILSVL